MKIEKGVISSSQLFFMVTALIQSSAVIGAFSAGISKQDSWLAVIVAAVVSLPALLIYLSLMRRFPGKNLMEILELIYGTFLGKTVSLLYILIFFEISYANLRFMGDLLLTYMMPETPLVVIAIIFTALAGWITRKGLEVLARFASVAVAIVTVMIIATFILLIPQMDVTNFLPILDIPPKDFIQGVHISTAIPICEVMAFMMIIPYVNQAKQVKKSFLLGCTAGVITLLADAIRNIAVLGPLYAISSSPSIDAVRLIDIANVLTRLEVLVITSLVLMLFYKTSLFFYSVVLGIAQTFRLPSYTPLVIPIGVLLIINSVVVFDSNVEQAYAATNTWPFYLVIYEFVIPAVSLIIAMIRGLTNKTGGISK
jgi:spore germination protein KB